MTYRIPSYDAHAQAITQSLTMSCIDPLCVLHRPLYHHTKSYDELLGGLGPGGLGPRGLGPGGLSLTMSCVDLGDAATVESTQTNSLYPLSCTVFVTFCDRCTLLTAATLANVDKEFRFHVGLQRCSKRIYRSERVEN